jgi:hypothetical protein
LIKNKNGDTLADCDSILNKLKNHLCQLSDADGVSDLGELQYIQLRHQYITLALLWYKSVRNLERFKKSPRTDKMPDWGATLPCPSGCAANHSPPSSAVG